MPLRLLAVSLGIVVTLGLARGALAQDAATKTETKADSPASTNDQDKDKEKDKASQKGKTVERVLFGGGCFWCTEAVFERIPGVKSVISGYAGGNVPNPTYDMVCSGLTGHAEVVQVEYDPAVVPYETLLNVFWKSHDPTTLNSQGPDFGTQYRSIIFYSTEAQRLASLKSYKELTARKAFHRPIVTELQPLKAFYPAEPYHQDYYNNHKGVPYSDAYIVPKLRKLHLKQ